MIPELEELVDTGIATPTTALAIMRNLSEEQKEFIDAMDWMLTHQLSSKNLSVGEKLAMTEEFKKEVALENEKKRLEGNKLGAEITNNNKNTDTVTLQLECSPQKNVVKLGLIIRLLKKQLSSGISLLHQ